MAVGSGQYGFVHRLDPDGAMRTIVGGGTSTENGIPGRDVRFEEDVCDVTVDGNGNVYIAESPCFVSWWPTDSLFRIRRLGPDGIITAFAGAGPEGFEFDGGAPLAVKTSQICAVATGPEGSLYIMECNGGLVYKVSSPMPGFSAGQTVIPAESGTELYVFDPDGRHLRTLNALTGEATREFTYENGLLSEIVSEHNPALTTRIERDASGKPLKIVAPHGQETTFTLGPNGYLATIRNPKGETVTFTYTGDGLPETNDEGLLETMTDARDHTWTFSYESDGRLRRDDDPAGGFKQLTRTESQNGYTVTSLTAEGRTRGYTVERLATNEQVRTTMRPDGTQTTRTSRADGSRESVSADGTVTTVFEGPDPRFGMAAPITEQVDVSTPGGLWSTTVAERMVTFADPENPLSLLTQTDITTVNGRPFTTEFDAGPSLRLERMGRVLQQPPLPFVDHVRVDSVPAGNLRHRLLLLQRCQGHLGFECRTVLRARLLHRIGPSLRSSSLPIPP